MVSSSSRMGSEAAGSAWNGGGSGRAMSQPREGQSCSSACLGLGERARNVHALKLRLYDVMSGFRGILFSVKHMCLAAAVQTGCWSFLTGLIWPARIAGQGA